MIIRRATYKETQQIFQNALSVLQEAAAGFVKPTWENAKSVVQSFIDHGHHYLVFVDNNMICGWIGIGELYDIHANQKAGYIAELYVLPQHRNKGIGKKLCMEAIRRMKEQGFKKVQLDVFGGNPAKHLYEALGFYDVTTLMEVKVN